MSVLADSVNTVISAIDGKLYLFWYRSYKALADPTSDLMAMLLVLSVIGVLYSAAFGGAPFTLQGLARLFARYAFVWGLMFGWTFFNQNIYDLLTQTPDDVIYIVMGAFGFGAETTATGIQGLLQDYIDTLMKIGDIFAAESASGLFGDIIAGLVFLAILFLTLLLSLGVLVIIGGSKILFGLLSSITPIMLLLSLNAPTRGLFDGWLRLFLGTVFTYLLAMLAIGFLLVATDATIKEFKDIDTIDSIGEITGLLLLTILMLFMLRSMPAYGAAIAGTLALGLQGIAEIRGAAAHTQGAYNRMHGLHPDGRQNNAPANRGKARARGAQRLRRLIGRGDGPDSGGGLGPAEARQTAKMAVHRRSAADDVRPEAAKRLHSDDEAATSLNAWQDVGPSGRDGLGPGERSAGASLWDRQSAIDDARPGAAARLVEGS